jgi:serine/threonine protein kinase
MAPEMVSGDKYSEKVDVYSLAVMLYEALSFRLNVMRLAMGQEPQAISEYAQSVALGHREKIPKNWPEPVRSLIEDAWQQVRVPGTSLWSAVLTVRGLRTVSSSCLLAAICVQECRAHAPKLSKRAADDGHRGASLVTPRHCHGRVAGLVSAHLCV